MDVTPLKFEFSARILSCKILAPEQINTLSKRYDPSFLQ